MYQWDKMLTGYAASTASQAITTKVGAPEPFDPSKGHTQLTTAKRNTPTLAAKK